MTEVLDASALLVYLRQEPGWGRWGVGGVGHGQCELGGGG